MLHLFLPVSVASDHNTSAESSDVWPVFLFFLPVLFWVEQVIPEITEFRAFLLVFFFLFHKLPFQPLHLTFRFDQLGFLGLFLLLQFTDSLFHAFHLIFHIFYSAFLTGSAILDFLWNIIFIEKFNLLNIFTQVRCQQQLFVALPVLFLKNTAYHLRLPFFYMHSCQGLQFNVK